MTPFEHYFATQSRISLKSIGDGFIFSSPTRTIKDASWDRKAAYLLWVEQGRPDLRTEAHLKPSEKSDDAVDDTWDIL